jgi:exodeoxyribonuclease-3
MEIVDHESYWCSAERKGYSGVATFTKRRPTQVQYGLGIPRFDTDGRVLVTEFPEFTLFNVYFPNGKRDSGRLRYKMEFYEAILEHWQALRESGKKLIICGDYNTAHKEIDLARPRENATVSGFLQIERDWMDKLVGLGYVDVFRIYNPLPNQYTWWDMMTRARERNSGWRIDYFFVTQDLIPRIRNADISCVMNPTIVR